MMGVGRQAVVRVKIGVVEREGKEEAATTEKEPLGKLKYLKGTT